MTDINLLPWREEQVKTKNNFFGAIAGSIALGCFGLCYMISLYINGSIEHEISEVNILSREINSLESKIVEIKGLQERQNLLLSKREIIQALQASRPFIVRVFEDITKTIPDGLFLLSMNRKENKLTLEGVSNSNSRISIFMRNLEQLKWLSNTILQEIKTQDVQVLGNDEIKNKEIIFKLQGDITY